MAKFFHREYFLLCFFLYQICVYVYEKPFASLKKGQQQELFSVIRNAVTDSSRWSQVHECIRRSIECRPVNFTQE